jgi:hypothetical protein
MASLPSGVTYESLEDRFLADAHSLLLKQRSGVNGDNPNNVTMINSLAFNANTMTYTLTATIACTTDVDTDTGNITVNAVSNYL